VVDCQFNILFRHFKKKLEEKIPVFMDEVSKNETFAISDVNLKFNKPEVMLLSTRERKPKV
jgi:HAE1 family hydrophobic/amphiphilic exporter-1/multidrug efflux pump